MSKQINIQKQQIINELIVQIKELKVQVDEKFLKKNKLNVETNEFLTQYNVFLGGLESQRDEVKIKIEQLRAQIEQLKKREDETPASDPSTREQENTLSEDNDNEFISEDPNSTSTANLTNDLETLEQELVEQNPRQILEKIRRHFARMWHPDIQQNQQDDEKMKNLNSAFMTSNDAADLLAAIPWDLAWEQSFPEESIGERWSRLMDWVASLKMANERLNQDIAQIQQTRHYRYYEEWNQYQNRQEFFVPYVERLRKEIADLENTYCKVEKILSDLQNSESK
jgi:hypothetical protein